jgi:hypothetical protein
MQTLTEKLLELAPPGGICDETVVGNLFPKASTGARRLLVHRAVQAGELLRLKPGLFMLAAAYRKSEAHPFAVAALLHGPSHVSLESALAHHGLIPEAVYQVASVTAARSRSFKTPLGVFTFRRVPADDPRAGVEAVKLENGAWVFIATPLRAIADMVYLNRHITWAEDGIGYLTDSLRIEPDDLDRLSFRPLDAICRSLHSRRTIDYLTGLRQAVKHGC